MIASIQSLNTASSGVSALTGSMSPLQGSSSKTPTGGAEPFGDLMKDAVGQVNHLEEGARTAITGLMSGAGVDVHEAMIASEKASMAFEMVLAVRNKAIQSYQSVMSMQF
jgi:flagellar hook-basal body complex protein FliE